MADSLQEFFEGVDLSASGLQQVALQVETVPPKLKISRLFNAPNQEHLEMEFPSSLDLEIEFPSISNLNELSQRVAEGRHNKPFRLTLVSSIIPKTSPRTLPLDCSTLEQGFGPQDYANWGSVGAALYRPLLKRTSEKHKRIYCNQAYTAAARTQIPRLAPSPRTCNFKLFPEAWLCDECNYTEREKAEYPWL